MWPRKLVVLALVLAFAAGGAKQIQKSTEEGAPKQTPVPVNSEREDEPAINTFEGRICLITPREPLPSELAVARSIKSSYTGEEDIEIVSEAELTPQAKEEANLILILRLNRSDFYEKAFQNFEATAGKGVIQGSQNPWKPERKLVLIGGFDDDGLLVAGDAFKEMMTRDLERYKQEPLWVGTREPLYYYSGGKKVFFEKVAGEYLVKLARDAEVSGAVQKVPAQSLIEIRFLLGDSGYRVWKVLPGTERSRQKQCAAMPAQSQKILWKTPVVRRRGESQKIYLLNKILVRFVDTTTDSEIEHLLAEYPVRDTNTPSRRENRYVLEVSNEAASRVCEIANSLYENPLTIYATPDWLEPERLYREKIGRMH